MIPAWNRSKLLCGHRGIGNARKEGKEHQKLLHRITLAFKENRISAGSIRSSMKRLLGAVGVVETAQYCTSFGLVMRSRFTNVFLREEPYQGANRARFAQFAQAIKA